MKILQFQELEKERKRLESLHKLQIEDSQSDPDLDRIVKLASHICGTPISLINLVDANKTFFKASVGTDVSGSAREISFCSHAIKGTGIMEITDALLDDRFVDNPLVTGDSKIRFYAGAPLNMSDGYNIGTLCVFDDQPKKLNDIQLEALETLSRQVVLQIEFKQLKKKLGKENVLSLLKMERRISELQNRIKLYSPFVPTSLVQSDTKEFKSALPELAAATLVVCKMFDVNHTLDLNDKIQQLKIYYTLVQEIVALHRGVIYRYDNEELSIIFSQPFSLPNFELMATKCAWKIKSLFLQEELLNKMGLSVIIHTGEVFSTAFDMISNIEYVIVGQTVDEIYQMKTKAKGIACEVIVTEEVLQKITNDFKAVETQLENGDSVPYSSKTYLITQEI